MNISSAAYFFQKNNYRNLHLFLVITCVSALLYAYIVETILHITPCPLCIYERFPYIFIIKMSFIALIVKKLSKYTIFFIVCNLLGGCILSAYHSGVERKIFAPSSLCSTYIHIPKHLSISEIKEIFYNQPIANCTKIAFKFLGLTMAEWNFLLSFFLLCLVLCVWIYSLLHKNDKLKITINK